MKQVFFFLFLTVTLHLTGQPQKPSFVEPITVKVDPRLELLSIVARLAGAGGYDSKAFRIYVEEIDHHFSKDSLHPAVRHIKQLVRQTNLGWDAIATMAVHLDYPSLNPKVPFTETIPEKRWTKEGATTFLPLLKQFFEQTNFDSFYRAHGNLYATVEARLQKILAQADMDWFYRFYGNKAADRFLVVPGLTLGTFLYGPKVIYSDGHKDIYAIMPNYRTDEKGIPVFEEQRILPYIIHEFSHSFVNHLVLKDTAVLAPFGEKIFAAVQRKMERNAYTSWPVALYESLIRAAVIRYQIEHDTATKTILSAVNEEYHTGFLWTRELVSLLGVYENSREQFKTLSTFMPVVNAFFKEVSQTIHHRQAEYGQRAPRLLTTLPLVDGVKGIDPSLTELTFVFSRPMSSYSFDWTALGKNHFPIQGAVGWDQTSTQLTMRVKLQPNWDYELKLTGIYFKTADGYPLEEVIIHFRTGN